MDRTELLEKTKKEVRSLLISAPRGVPARLLLSDYKMVTGKELPYRQLGFRSLDDLVRAIPEVVRADMGSTGQLTFFGVANANTRQIARFVQVQKKPKLKRSGMPPAISFRTPVNRTAFTSRNRYGPRSTPRPMSRSYGRPGGWAVHFVLIIRSVFLYQRREPDSHPHHFLVANLLPHLSIP